MAKVDLTSAFCMVPSDNQAEKLCSRGVTQSDEWFSDCRHIWVRIIVATLFKRCWPYVTSLVSHLHSTNLKALHQRCSLDTVNNELTKKYCRRSANGETLCSHQEIATLLNCEASICCSIRTSLVCQQLMQLSSCSGQTHHHIHLNV